MDGMIDANPLLENGDLEQMAVAGDDQNDDAPLSADGAQGRRGRRRNNQRRDEC